MTIDTLDATMQDSDSLSSNINASKILTRLFIVFFLIGIILVIMGGFIFSKNVVWMSDDGHYSWSFYIKSINAYLALPGLAILAYGASLIIQNMLLFVVNDGHNFKFQFHLYLFSIKLSSKDTRGNWLAISQTDTIISPIELVKDNRVGGLWQIFLWETSTAFIGGIIFFIIMLVALSAAILKGIQYS